MQQCVAACFSVLQCVAVCCSALTRTIPDSTVSSFFHEHVPACFQHRCIAIGCSVFQCVAVCGCCSVLQCVAECCDLPSPSGVFDGTVAPVRTILLFELHDGLEKIRSGGPHPMSGQSLKKIGVP